jgi:hypothetical protein
MGMLLSKVLLHKGCVKIEWNTPMKSGGTDNTLKVIWIKEKERKKETEEGREGRKDGEREEGRGGKMEREEGRERGRGGGGRKMERGRKEGQNTIILLAILHIEISTANHLTKTNSSFIVNIEDFEG